MTDSKKYLLGEDRIPKAWYNIVADLPVPPPAVLHPGTGQPIGPGDLAPLFPMAVIMQEVSTERWIDIPEPVRDIYRMWRQSPLVRAERLETALDTPARIFFKYEGVSPSGSHKPNTAVAQAFYNKQERVKRLTTPKIRDEILDDATALGGMGFSAHFRQRNRGWRLRQPAPRAIFAVRAGVFEAFGHDSAIGRSMFRFPKARKRPGSRRLRNG